MTLTLNISSKLLLLLSGEKLPAHQLKHPLITELLENNILKKHITSRSKALIYLPHAQSLQDYLHNHYGIPDLQNYYETLKKDDITRADAISASSDSKLKSIRTFKGFLINCYHPLQASLNGNPLILNPIEGAFHFIYDYESLTIPEDITIVGIENPENFRYINNLKQLFTNPLFVSRYPQNQSKDLLKWLQAIPNQYLHFGDFDFEGIGIYLNEYKRHLGERARFFVPENIEVLIAVYGNKKLYDTQRIISDIQSIKEKDVERLIQIIHQYKKGLEQEILLYNN